MDIIEENNQMRKIILFALILGLIDNYISRPLLTTFNMQSDIYICLFKVLELTVCMILNAILLKQRVFLRATVGKNSKIFLLIFLGIIILSIRGHAQNLLLAIVIGSGGAIAEEFMFRGVILGKILSACKRKMSTKDIFFSIVFSSVIFGVYHIINLNDQSLILTVAQIIQAFGMGCLFGAIYVRKGSLLFSMCLHFFIDFEITIFTGSSIEAAPTSWHTLIASLVIMIFYFGLAMLVLDISDKTSYKQWQLISKLL